MTALDRFTAGPFVSRHREVVAVERELSELAVKAPSLEAPVSSLSGGNQQKIVLARAMLSEPAILVADEPTQGVDVGARAEIYRILREVAARGVPVVVASSDALELEGLCDRVIVMSRGHAVATLEGDDVTEERMVHAAISATLHSAEQAVRHPGRRSRIARFIEGDYAPVAALAVVMLALGIYVWNHNHLYTSDYNINSVMFACAALGFISLGQTFALLLGGIDLSVGPLAGFLVVLGSFFILDGRSPAVWVLGFALMLLSAIGIGLLNGALIRYAKFTAVAATLVTYIGLGGLAFTLRSAPDGYIAASVTNAIATKVGPVPIAFIVFVLCAFGLELALRKTPLGLRIRAVGLGRGVGAARRRPRQPDGAHRLPRRVGPHPLRRGRPARAARRRRPRAGQRVHPHVDHGRRARRHEPARRARHLHRHADGCGAQRSGAQRDRVPQPGPEVAVHLPGGPDRRGGPHLQPGASRRAARSRPTVSSVGTARRWNPSMVVTATP